MPEEREGADGSYYQVGITLGNAGMELILSLTASPAKYTLKYNPNKL